MLNFGKNDASSNIISDTRLDKNKVDFYITSKLVKKSRQHITSNY